MACIGGLELNKSIVAAIGNNPVESAIRAKKLGAAVLELRIDLLDDYSEAGSVLQEMKKTGLPVIITNRMKQEGGAWEKSEDERIDVLYSLIPFSDAVDIELCAEDRDYIVSEAKRKGKTVIISTHDFRKTPPSDVMKGILECSFTAGADIAKLAVMPDSFDDVLRLLEVTLHSEDAVCTIAMGDIGKHSRVISPVYGSVITYGSVDTATAPGQLRVDKLKSILELI